MGPKGPWEVFCALHILVSFYNKSELIYVSDVDKNGGKISDFRFLQKVLKLDFPKVYFFGSLIKSLSPIIQNPKIAAIFHKTNSNVFICSPCRRYMPRCFAPRRAGGPTVTRAEGPTVKGRRPVFSQPHNTKTHHMFICSSFCSRS